MLSRSAVIARAAAANDNDNDNNHDDSITPSLSSSTRHQRTVDTTSRRAQFTIADLFGPKFIEPVRSKPLLNVNRQGMLNVLLNTEAHNRLVEEQGMWAVREREKQMEGAADNGIQSSSEASINPKARRASPESTRYITTDSRGDSNARRQRHRDRSHSRSPDRHHSSSRRRYSRSRSRSPVRSSSSRSSHHHHPKTLSDNQHHSDDRQHGNNNDDDSNGGVFGRDNRARDDHNVPIRSAEEKASARRFREECEAKRRANEAARVANKTKRIQHAQDMFTSGLDVITPWDHKGFAEHHGVDLPSAPPDVPSLASVIKQSLASDDKKHKKEKKKSKKHKSSKKKKKEKKKKKSRKASRSRSRSRSPSSSSRSD